jgi:hypothetical protein
MSPIEYDDDIRKESLIIFTGSDCGTHNSELAGLSKPSSTQTSQPGSIGGSFRDGRPHLSSLKESRLGTPERAE